MGKLRAVLLWSVAVLALAGGACSDRPQDLWVYVEAEVLEPRAPVEVVAGGVLMGEHRLMYHEILVNWREDFPAILGDSRFMHRIKTGDTELLVAGPGCIFDQPTDGFICQAVWLGARLEKYSTHSFGLLLQSPPDGRLRLRRGVYVVEQEFAWWRAVGEESGHQPRDPDGTFTMRLTYTVE